MNEKKKLQPFFARFLEGNVEKEDLRRVKGGTTLKYPSDNDESPTP